VYEPQEPVGFGSTKEPTAVIELEKPQRGRFLTIQFYSSLRFEGLGLEYVKPVCVHGEHPLGDILGTPEAAAKVKEIRAELFAAMKTWQNEQGKDEKKEVKHDGKEEKKEGKGMTLAMDESLAALIQSICSRLNVSPMIMDAIMFAPTSTDLIRFKLLEHVPLNVMRARMCLLKYLNRLVTPLLHYVDISTYQTDEGEEGRDDSDHRDDGQSDDKSLSHVIHQLKGLYFRATKQSVFEALLQMGQLNPQYAGFGTMNNQPRLVINRIKAANAKLSGKDPSGQTSIFGQIFTQLRGMRYEDFQKSKKDEQVWIVQFLGEGSIDVGGPYRESITNICSDLMSDATPLFIRSPNGRNSVGLNREKWVVNPSSNTQLHLEMYESVGVLMGIALRTKAPLSLDLPSMVWKQLLTQKVDVSDLEAVDKLCVQALDQIQELKPDKFADLVTQKFTTQLSDNTEVDVKKDGKSFPVTYENRKEFRDLSIERRLKEPELQIKSIRKGLNAVVSVRNLSLFSWLDLEEMVCGNPTVDIEMLRRHTKFSSSLSASSPVVKFLFQALQSFNQEERQLFLRFVWGRNRLPATDADWSQHFTINTLNADDNALPISHTCFFSLDLPPYSAYEILREKLRYAIVNTTAIDVDFNPDSSSLNAWVE